MGQRRDEANVARSGFRPLTGFRGGRQADRWQNIGTRTKMDSKRTGVQGGVACSDSEMRSLSAISLPLGPRGAAPAPRPRALTVRPASWLHHRLNLPPF